MKTLFSSLFLILLISKNAYSYTADVGGEVGCVISLKTSDQLLMNDLRPAEPIGNKRRFKGTLAGYNFLVTVAENKSVLRVTVKSSHPESPLALTTFTPLNNSSQRPRLLLTVPHGILELRCRRWVL